MSEQHKSVDTVNDSPDDDIVHTDELASTTRRWEMIIYPSLFAFVVLAFYGFYLIYNLQKDVHYLAISVDSNMTSLASNMQSMSQNMGQLTSNVRSMTVSLDSIDKKVGTLEPMLANIDSMDHSMKSMTRSTDSMNYGVRNMQRDMSHLNRNIGKPMSFINTFLPW